MNKITEKEKDRRSKLILRNENNKGKKYSDIHNINEDNINKYTINRVCKYCGKENIKWKTHKRSEFCNNKCKRYYLKKNNPIEYKALTLFACIPLGKGKNKIALGILNNYLNTDCRYCDSVLTLKNISLDHKIPVHWKRNVRNNPLLGDINNIHLICKKCNQSKRDLTDEQYLRLLEFLNKNIDIKDNILIRLRSTFYGYKK
jgi:hypothetical protein